MNAAFLGQTEFTDLAEPADWALLKKLGRHACDCLSPACHWLPPKELREGHCREAVPCSLCTGGCLVSPLEVGADVAGSSRH